MGKVFAMFAMFSLDELLFCDLSQLTGNLPGKNFVVVSSLFPSVGTLQRQDGRTGETDFRPKVLFVNEDCQEVGLGSPLPPHYDDAHWFKNEVSAAGIGCSA